jgi:flagellin-like hook-associated protein FlgL
VYVNPDNNTDTLAVTFAAGDIISDVSDAAWDLDGAGGAAKSAADVQTEINKATSYLVKAEKYEEKIERQMTITDNMIQSKKAAQSIITDIDEVEELNKATNEQIRQQATIAMIAQANVSQSYISMLYGGKL